MTAADGAVRRRPDIVVAPVGSFLLAYDRGHEVAHLLNPAAAAIWDLVDGGRSPGAIAAELHHRFAEVPTSIDDDVVTVLRDLEDLGLTSGDAHGPAGASGAAGAGGARGAGEGTPPAVGLMATTDRDAPTADPATVGPFDALGFGFDIVAEAAVAARFAATLRTLAVAPSADGPGTDGGHRYVLVARADDDPPGSSVELWFDDRVVHAGPLSTAASYLLWHVNNRAVEADYDGLLIHASSVLTPAGALVLSGTMDAGKSTLVTALAATGRPYVTDEAVAITGPVDDVDAYPKPIGLDPGSWPLFPALAGVSHPDVTTRWWLDPATVGPEATAVPNRSRHPLAALVFIQFQAGVETALQPVEAPDAALALTGNLFNLARDPQRGLDTVVRLATRRPCFRLDIGTLDTAVAAIATLTADLP